MRIPLATTIRTRTGVPAGKDARLVNSYVEVKGEQSVVRKRPAAQGGVAVGSGVAQGGINGFFIYGDVVYPVTEATGTNWDAGTIYPQGSMVSYNFEDFWAVDDDPQTPNQDNNPETSPDRWSRTPTYCVAPVVPAPVVTGTSTSYTNSATPPTDVTLSDVIVGHYCAGILHKKSVAHYTIGASTSSVTLSLISVDSYAPQSMDYSTGIAGNNPITVRATFTGGFTDFNYSGVISWSSPSVWGITTTEFTGSLVRTYQTGSPSVPANFTTILANGDSLYELTITVTESYYWE